MLLAVMLVWFQVTAAATAGLILQSTLGLQLLAIPANRVGQSGNSHSASQKAIY
jgi:hypothetical protein